MKLIYLWDSISIKIQTKFSGIGIDYMYEYLHVYIVRQHADKTNQYITSLRVQRICQSHYRGASFMSQNLNLAYVNRLLYKQNQGHHCLRYC